MLLCCIQQIQNQCSLFVTTESLQKMRQLYPLSIVFGVDIKSTMTFNRIIELLHADPTTGFYHLNEVLGTISSTILLDDIYAKMEVQDQAIKMLSFQHYLVHLNEDVIKQLVRLNGVACPPRILRRRYVKRKSFIPCAIQLVLDTKFATELENSVDSYEISEFDLPPDEKDHVFFEHNNDYILLCNGVTVVACKESESCSDFPVYVLDFNTNCTTSMKLSQWLASLQISK